MRTCSITSTYTSKTISMRIPLNSEPHKTNIIIQTEILKAQVSHCIAPPTNTGLFWQLLEILVWYKALEKLPEETSI